MSLVNLCFHGLGTPKRDLEHGEDEYWLPERRFIEILLALRPHMSHVRLSFDDGNHSDVEAALPALLELGLTADFFPIAGRIGSQGSVGGDDLEVLAQAGMRIGSHGMWHSSWRRMLVEDSRAELDEARLIISRFTRQAVTTAACPKGEYDHSVLSKLRRLGYTSVFTSDRAYAKRSAWLQPRFSITSMDNPETVLRIVTTHPNPVRKARDAARLCAKRWR